jgi:anti-sigma-K factor RskA
LSGMQDHGEMKTLVASYVIGALPPEEVARIRSHILTCDECMAEAESLAATTSTLALAVTPETVPEGFADRLMGRVAEPEAEAEPQPRAARRWSLTTVLSVAALLVVIAVLAAGWFDARSDLARNQRVVDVVLDARGGIDLAGSGDGVGKVVSSEEGGSVFVAQGLDAAPEDHIYQLWLMKGSCADPTSASCRVHGVGTFDSEAGISVLRTSRPLSGYEKAAVTIEPTGGSAAPTTEPVLISS